MTGRIVIVPINPVSDADPSHRPTGPNYTLVDPPDTYLEKIATQWMQARNEAKPGVRYLLDKLPDGYAVYQKPRQTGLKAFDKWLYGHPNHSVFDSPNRFFPHFLHLMSNGNNVGCDCTVCAKKGGRIPPIGSSSKSVFSSRAAPSQPYSTPHASSLAGAPKKRGRPVGWRPIDLGRVDDEGTPDVYRNLIDKLQREGQVNEPIKEPYSMDWRAERELLPAMLDKISKQPFWVPRLGELVLFVRKIDAGQEILFDESSGEYLCYDTKTSEFTHHPKWEAGVVSQTATEDLRVEDLTQETNKEFDVNYSGFRIEPLPDPNSKDKPYSKQYKYVPLHYIRPFVFWQEILRGTSREEWHPTIRHALTVMSTFSLVEKYHMKGTWPTAEVSCKGIYIGPELILVGDTVRLMPSPGESKVTDVLEITSIKLKFENLDTASNNDRDEGHPYNTKVHVTGRAFTLDAGRAYDERPIDPASGRLPHSLDTDGSWFHRHDPSKKYLVPFSRIMSRCYEPEAMRSWFSTSENSASDTKLSLNRGLRGTQQGRTYSQNHDKRMQNGALWFWADCRTETLDLETLNGREVGSHDTTRDPKKWRADIKVMDGVASTAEKIAVRHESLAERPRLSSSMSQRNSLIGAALHNVDSEMEGLSSAAEDQLPRKRSRSVVESFVDIDDYGHEDEDAAADRFVDELAEGIGMPVDDDEDDSDASVIITASIPMKQEPKKQKMQVVI